MTPAAGLAFRGSKNKGVAVGGGGPDPVSVTHITDGTTSSASTSATTASVTPGINQLQLLLIHANRFNASMPDPTVTGCGLTWVFAGRRVVRLTASTEYSTVFLFRAMGTPSTGSLTISFGATSMSRIAWSWDQAANVSTFGTNGSGAIVQIQVNNNGVSSQGTTSAAPLVNLVPFAHSNNATWAGLAWTSSTGFTPGMGFTETAENGNSIGRLATQWKVSNDTSVDGTLGSSAMWGMFAVELAGTNIYVLRASSQSGSINSDSETSYANARSSGGGGFAFYASPGQGIPAGQEYDPGWSTSYSSQSARWNCREGFMSFDTSVIVGTIQSATLYGGLLTEFSPTDYLVEARLHDWGTTLTTADWVGGADLSSKTLVATLDTNGIGDGYKYKLFVESGSALRDNLNRSGTTRIMLSSERMRLNLDPFTTGGGAGYSEALTFWGYNSETDYFMEPKLVVVV